MKTRLKTIGWREWVALPELGIDPIKAKVDTGARSSSIHAFDIATSSDGGLEWVRFKIYPAQRESRNVVECRVAVVDYRNVRSSNGQSERRPVIVTQVELLGESWPIELTLSNRDEMGFRMLLGRSGIRKRFLVDAGSSYYGGRKKEREAL